MSRAVAAGSASLPFGLAWADLAPALPGTSGPVTAEVIHRPQGRHHGGHPSASVRVRCPTASGVAEVRLFVKQNADRPEAPRYRLLAEAGVPVPRLHAAVDRGGAEVLVLDELPVVGLERDDVDPALGLLARLASRQDAPAELAPPPAGSDQATFEVSLAAALARIDREQPGSGTTRWLATYRRLLPEYRALPTALSHGELAAHQFGRTDQGRLVVFDLATVGRRPRFFDLAAIIGVLADLAGRSEQTLLDDYLGRLHRLGVDPGTTPQAEAELRVTRFVGVLETVPWLVSLAADGDDPESSQLLDRHLRTTAAVHAEIVR
ncbi:hypothetical protein FHX74_001553 [Friedmanniella endophytica]|uniref:Aminoglycoside phosphotransferase domain-containing protein n=1 Tax=Microlunatus kandeliicorticis TaxID=1759536 RepID=A0A7W3P5I0_9ACTN|nr:phosphotransferase [Microlunatus kandeliicorticis]MBA8793948.1 hypothetical protein [Microlunatus kandeliicorticis]